MVERVQAGLVQCGGKTVHRVGLPLVDFDVALSALTHNLRRLGSLLKQQPELEAQLQQEADRQKAAQRLLFNRRAHLLSWPVKASFRLATGNPRLQQCPETALVRCA